MDETKLKIGDILQFSRLGAMSILIRVMTRSKYSHSACYMGDGLIVESFFGGVRLQPTHILENESFDVYRHKNAKRKDLEKATRWMWLQCGKGYDLLGILGILLVLLGKKEENNFDSKRKYWCSELVADGYLYAGIPLDVEKRTSTISPDGLSKDSNLVKVEW